ncbi:MAG: AraC family transcriptional regulator [Pseudomonadota bacterium]
MNGTDAANSLQIDYVAASADMRDFVHTLFVLRSGESAARSIMPAYSAQLSCFVEGSGRIDYPGRGRGQSHDLTLNAPMLQAAPLALEGPILNIGASFTPLGWSIFSGLRADTVHDTAFAAKEVVPPQELAPLETALRQCREGAITHQEYARAVEDMIRRVCRLPTRRPRADHRAVLRAIEDWLESAFNPPIAELYDRVNLSSRQVQRLCRRYYGVPPAQLLKRYRAIRAAMILAQKDPPAQLRDEILAAYFDQAHLIRDVRRYTGFTPKALLKEPIAQEMLDPSGHGRTGERLRKR